MKLLCPGDRGALEGFTRAYINTAFATEHDGESMLCDSHDPRDLAPEAKEIMEQDCARFWEANADYILFGYTGDPRYTEAESAGADFWLTRSGHGTGFWDGDWDSNNDLAWPEDAGNILTLASDTFGECSLYVGDDGRIFHS